MKMCCIVLYLRFELILRSTYTTTCILDQSFSTLWALGDRIYSDTSEPFKQISDPLPCMANVDKGDILSELPTIACNWLVRAVRLKGTQTRTR